MVPDAPRRPDDLARHHIADGVRVRSAVETTTVDVQASETMMPGVACLPHGYGHQRGGARHSRAHQVEGASFNDLTDPGARDAPSGNAALSGLHIHLEATATRVSDA